MSKLYSFKVTILALFCCLFATFNATAQNCTVNSGVPETICPGQLFVLKGKASGLFASGGNAVWSQVSGPAVTLGTPVIIGQDIQVNVTGYAPGNTYVFKLSARCTDGSPVSQNVTFIAKPATQATAGIDQISCPGNNVVTLNGNSPGANETAAWSIINNAGGVTLNSSSSPSTTLSLSPNASGTSKLKWTIIHSNGCGTTDTVDIVNRGGVTPVNAGADIILGNCYSLTTFTQLSATYGGTNVRPQHPYFRKYTH